MPYSLCTLHTMFSFKINSKKKKKEKPSFVIDEINVSLMISPTFKGLISVLVACMNSQVRTYTLPHVELHYTSHAYSI